MADDDFGPIVDMILEDDLETATGHLLIEHTEERVARALGGETMPMNYLIKFEEYLDDHDLYLYDGWNEARLLAKPNVDKFWVTFIVFCKKGIDLRGALRIVNDKEGQNEVKAKKVRDGHVLKFRILKRYLDEIERRNRLKAEQEAEEQEDQVD